MDEAAAEPARAGPMKKRATRKAKAKKRTAKKARASSPLSAPSPRGPSKGRSRPRRGPSQPRRQDEEGGFLYWAVPLAILVIIAVLAILLFQSNNAPGVDDTVLVTVNGEPILKSDLEAQYSILPARVQQALTKDEVLDQMIDELVLLQEAEARGLDVNETEVDEALVKVLERNNIGLSQLEEALAKRNVTLQELRGLLRKQALINKLFDQAGLDNVTVSEADIKAFYAENKEQFVVPEQVTVRHILLPIKGGETEENVTAFAQELIERYNNGEDFCTLVKNYSVDAGSKETCGEYTFPRGRMVPPFEEKAFDLDVGDIGIVTTSFGVHIIEKLDEEPEHTLAFEDVRDDIENSLKEQARMQQYRSFIKELREAAEIVYPSEEQDASKAVMTDDKEKDSDELQASEPKEEEGQAESDAPEPGSEAATATVTVTEQETEEETEEETPTEEQAESQGETEVSKEEAVAACLKDADAALYGAEWSSETKAQLDLFGTSKEDVAYVECSQEGTKKPTPECAKLNIPYPTWVIGGKQYFGFKTLEELETLCKQ